MSVRRLGTAIGEWKTGIGIRGTRLAEPKAARKRGKIVHPDRRLIFMWTPPLGKINNRDFVRELRASLISAARIALSKNNLQNWKTMKTEDYPVIMIVGKARYYRGTSGQAPVSEYVTRVKSNLSTFPKTSSTEIPAKDILAVIRPTKRELQELQNEVEKFGKNSKLLMSEGIVRLLVSKSARAIVKAYHVELDAIAKK